jgi:UPF0755 protein
MKLKISIATVVVFFGLIFALFFLSTPLTSDSTLKPFVINQGDNLITIGSRLEKNKFIKSALPFYFWSVVNGQSKSLQAGGFRLSSSWDVKTVINNLTKGGSHDSWFKIIPGQRLAEIDLLADTSLEGYLFPDSYLIPDYFTPEDTIALIKKNFDKKFESVRAKSSLSDAEIVTLASILEREAKTKIDKQKVAGILLNRLKINMALQVDAAVQYGRDTLSPPKKYWLTLSKFDLQINSPFNTYQNRGLPPSPICNPGLDSLYAAFNPFLSTTPTLPNILNSFFVH